MITHSIYAGMIDRAQTICENRYILGTQGLYANRLLKRVGETGDAGQKLAENWSLQIINVYFRAIINASAATQVASQHPATDEQ